MPKGFYEFSFKRVGKIVRMSDGWTGEIMGEANGATVCLEKGKANVLGSYRTFGNRCASNSKGLVKLVEKVVTDAAGEIYVKLYDDRKQLDAFLRRAKIARTWDSAAG